MAVYFVYKLKIKGTGFFYIGVTTNLDVRRSQHFSAINVLIDGLRFKRGGGPTAKEGYYKVAKEWIKGKRFQSIEKSFKKEVCQMVVIDIKDTAKEARELEHSLIQKHIKNIKCFNKCPASYYSHKTPAKRNA